MTPAYETDPVEPKLMPKDKWFEVPLNSAPNPNVEAHVPSKWALVVSDPAGA